MAAPKNGRDLERAVWLIEQLVLGATHRPPGKITVEPNKRIKTDGVLDEIDLYVRREDGPGYESVFLFECKDRKKPVAKGVVDELSAKMERLKASRGFIIARVFTKVARASAKRHGRIMLHVATDAPLSSVFTRNELAFYRLENLTIKLRPEPTFSTDVLTDIPPTAVPTVIPVEFLTNPTTLAEFVELLARFSLDRRMATEQWPLEPYFGEGYLFRGRELMVAGQPIDAIALEATIDSRQATPTRVVGFRVEGRGKVVQLFYSSPDGEEFVAFGATTEPS